VDAGFHGAKDEKKEKGDRQKERPGLRERCTTEVQELAETALIR